MSKVVNLQRVRKAKYKVKKRVQANEKSAFFGRKKAQKTLEEHSAAKAAKHLDSHKRDQDE